jgi:ubiquinone/menaquinone biosynthesis C-methylase UbiE
VTLSAPGVNPVTVNYATADGTTASRTAEREPCRVPSAPMMAGGTAAREGSRHEAGGEGSAVLCARYADPRLAAVYDALNPPGAHTAFYLGLAGDVPVRVLDVGCGTGLLGCELAARGHQVTGADPAAAMLTVARRRPGGDRVRWIEADAAGLPAGNRFDLVIMTGHVFQIFLDDRDIRAALAAVRRYLAPGGRVAFETRNPAVREWAEWNPRETWQHIDAAGVSADVYYDIRSVAGELVTYETCYRFAAEDTVTVPETIRFMGQDQVAAFLADAGLTQVTWYGDWDRSPVRPVSPELIAVAR